MQELAERIGKILRVHQYSQAQYEVPAFRPQTQRIQGSVNEESAGNYSGRVCQCRHRGIYAHIAIRVHSDRGKGSYSNGRPTSEIDDQLSGQIAKVNSKEVSFPAR